MTQVECICSMHGTLLPDINVYAISGGCVRHVTVECTVTEFSLAVSVVHERQLDCTYTADISLLAHGFNVKLSPCL